MDEPKNGDSRPQQVAQIVVTVYSDGGVNVNGPLQDKFLCIAALELAKLTVHDFKGEPQRVVPVQMMPHLKVR